MRALIACEVVGQSAMRRTSSNAVGWSNYPSHCVHRPAQRSDSRLPPGGVSVDFRAREQKSPENDRSFQRLRMDRDTPAHGEVTGHAAQARLAAGDRLPGPGCRPSAEGQRDRRRKGIRCQGLPGCGRHDPGNGHRSALSPPTGPQGQNVDACLGFNGHVWACQVICNLSTLPSIPSLCQLPFSILLGIRKNNLPPEKPAQQSLRQ